MGAECRAEQTVFQRITRHRLFPATREPREKQVTSASNWYGSHVAGVADDAIRVREFPDEAFVPPPQIASVTRNLQTGHAMTVQPSASVATGWK